MGKKSKAEKKGRNGKRKDEIVVEAHDHDLASMLVQAARSMRTVLSRNLVESGLYAGQDGVMLALAETDGLTAGALAARLGVKAPTMTDPGRDRLQTIAEAGQHSEKLATRGLTDKQVRTLLKLLRAVDSNLQAARAAD